MVSVWQAVYSEDSSSPGAPLRSYLNCMSCERFSEMVSAHSSNRRLNWRSVSWGVAFCYYVKTARGGR